MVLCEGNDVDIRDLIITSPCTMYYSHPAAVAAAQDQGYHIGHELTPGW